MKYEEFKERVSKKVQEKLGEEVRIELHRIVKNNSVVLDGMSIVRDDSNISPTFYLNDFYKDYLEGMTMDEILETIGKVYEAGKQKPAFENSFYADFENVRGKLACKLISRERNKELLKQVPYREFMDLAVVVYYLFEDEKIGTGTILVYDRHLKNWHVTADELLEIARKNTLRILPDEFMGIRSVLEKYHIELKEDFGSDDKEPMYVLTNSRNYFGAASLMYDSVLQKIGEELRDDFWVLPSSIHECIIVPRHIDIAREALEQMVRDINRCEVDAEEYLSDRIYFYRRDLHKLFS